MATASFGKGDGGTKKKKAKKEKEKEPETEATAEVADEGEDEEEETSKKKDKNARIFSYGARPPTKEAPLAFRLLFLSSLYYNALTAIERERRRRYRAIERTVVSEATNTRLIAAERAYRESDDAVRMAKGRAGKPSGDKIAQARMKKAAAAALAPLAEVKKAALDEVKAARVAFKAETAPLRAAIVILGAARTEEKIARKKAGVRDRNDATIADKLDDANVLAVITRQHARDIKTAKKELAAKIAKAAKAASSAQTPATMMEDVSGTSGDSAVVTEAPEKKGRGRKKAPPTEKVVWDLPQMLAAATSGSSEIARRLHESDSIAATAITAARNASGGLHWGCYTLVENAVRQASKDTPGDPKQPRDKDVDAEGLGVDSEGRIGSNQLPKGGLDVADLEENSRFRLRVLPLPKEEDWKKPKNWPVGKVFPSPNMIRRRHAVASICVHGEWIEWPFLMHRPLPEGCRVLGAWVSRERIGSKFRWDLQITISEDDAFRARKPPPKKGEDSAVAIELGWRSSDGFRGGYWMNASGERGAIRLPEITFSQMKSRHKNWTKKGKAFTANPAMEAAGWRTTLPDALEYLDGIRAIRDRHFDVARAFLREWIAEQKESGKVLPEWFVRETEFLHAWKRATKLERLRKWWSAGARPVWKSRDGQTEVLQRPEGDQTILDGLLEWSKEKDSHLWDWEVNGRDRIYGVRKDHYRLIASHIARDYSHVIITKLDLTTWAKLPEPEDGDPSDDKMLRKAQRSHAPSELRDAVKNAAKRDGRTYEEVDPAHDTMTCTFCGGKCVVNDELWHTCEHCGNEWDRDENACINRLRKAGYDKTRELRCSVRQHSRSKKVSQRR